MSFAGVSCLGFQGPQIPDRRTARAFDEERAEIRLVGIHTVCREVFLM